MGRGRFLWGLKIKPLTLLRTRVSSRFFVQSALTALVVLALPMANESFAAISSGFGGSPPGSDAFMAASAQLTGTTTTNQFLTAFPSSFCNVDYTVAAAAGTNASAEASAAVGILEQNASGTLLKFNVALRAVANTPDPKLASASASVYFSILIHTQKRTYLTWTGIVNGNYPAYVEVRAGTRGPLVSLDNNLKSAWLEAGKTYEFYFSASSLLNSPVSLPLMTFTLDEAPPPPATPPPPLPLPSNGVIIYYGLPDSGYYLNPWGSYPYGIAVGDWWNAGLSGQPWTGGAYYRPQNIYLTPPRPDHDFGFGVPFVGEWPIVMCSVSGGATTPVTAQESLAVFEGINSCAVSATYGASGQYQVSNTSQGFMLAIAAGEPIEVSYIKAPVYPDNIVGSFELPSSGDAVRLDAGTHYFGVLAAYHNFPPLYTNWLTPNPPRGGGDEWSILIKTLHVPEPNPDLPKFTGLNKLSNGYALQWSDALSRAVHLQRRASLSTGSWETIRTNVVIGSCTDTNAPPGSVFYRLLIPAQ